MCGIAGIISPDKSKIHNDVLSAMGNSIAHRGPDGQKLWKNGDNVAGFVHRRLCVIDTSAAADQPMHYPGGYTIIHNGEIYNYIELRDDLVKKGYAFKTASDTEVILAAFVHYKEKCVELFDGMFAFAIWDENEKTLFCARDRFGEKPFYYAEDNGFYFASEIKALRKAGITTEHDDGMLLYFLGTGNTVDPADSSRTFYKKIKKLPAAHWLKYNASNQSISIKRYWHVSVATSDITEFVALEKLDELLMLSISRRLRSDVSLGTSLSGGIDSSSIVAYMDRLGFKNFKTFTASFPGFEKDETAKAKLVADRFNLDNFSVAPTAEGLIGDFERLAYHQDEPMASASVYAQFKVFELAAKENVTVLLDGQGADEVLAGYDHYRSWRLRSFFPQFTALFLQRRSMREVSNEFIDRDFAQSASRQIKMVKPVVRELNDLLYFDTFCIGLEQLLRYADRNSMAHGREVRLPFLSHELVSFVFSLPASFKLRDGYNKWVLRKLMQGRLPDNTVWSKRKTGFEPPQKNWMEHLSVQKYIMDAKEKLVEDRILNKVVLDQRPSVSEAYARRSYDWRWMATSVFIHKKGV